ncbi:hypothetical protein ACFX2C_047152 [Malus domestica]
MYPQRQGLCSLSFWQQVPEGADPDLIGPRHGLNSTGLHVTASAVLATSQSTTATAKHNTKLCNDCFIVLVK